MDLITPAPVAQPLPSGVSTRWLWVAIAALASCMVALASAWLMLPSPGAIAAAARSGGETGAASGAAPAMAQSRAPAGAQGIQVPDHYENPGYAGSAIAAQSSERSSTVRPSFPSSSSSSSSSSSNVQPAAVPACSNCGLVESVEPFSTHAPTSGVGMIAGGVLGGLVGNQIGGGNGRAAATVIGAVGGGYVGHQVEKNARSGTAYRVSVRMRDGSLRTFTRSQPVAEGAPVRLEGRGFRMEPQQSATTTTVSSSSMHVAHSY